ncbi:MULTISPECIES: hypothetical protein [Asticcacaulis]|uniref:hypothetical protein n=1 Tax=Asticcacaulis TaxID=76890 RepID=UPI001AE1BF33|nr:MULTISPECIES: hypothetical protein [Asticcacaulis]MBP2160047.1 hypothetical protein [Asticcacaulis solisilvae]MDR6801092.1 hypothetical protein [Asticcacaulis sp. BE141]
MKRLALLSLCLLAACSKPKEAPAPEPSAMAPPPVQDTWPGKYSGDLIVRIDAAHKVTLIEAATDGCAGDLGVVEGGLVSTPLSENELQLILHPEPALTCTINIRKSGDTLTVVEAGDCDAYHGKTCSFNGTVTRTK